MLKIKRFCFRKETPRVILFSYDYTSQYRELHVSLQSRGRPSKTKLVQLYKTTLPISEAKKKDLVKLCNSGVIPKEYHQWFKSLPSSKKLKSDETPEPTTEEYFNDLEDEVEDECNSVLE